MPLAITIILTASAWFATLMATSFVIWFIGFHPKEYWFIIDRVAALGGLAGFVATVVWYWRR